MVSSVAIYADSPMVKLGKMMWNEIVKANCSRASRTGSKSINVSASFRRAARIVKSVAAAMFRFHSSGQVAAV
jgi:hypothetical protein